MSTVVHNIEHIPVSSHLSCAIIVHPNRCKPNNNTTFFMVMVDSWLHLFFFALHWPLAILSTHHILYPGSSHTRAPRCRGRERSGWMACPLIPKWDGSYLRGFAKKTGNQHQPSPMKLGDTGVRVKNQRGDLESLPFCLQPQVAKHGPRGTPTSSLEVMSMIIIHWSLSSAFRW